MTKFLHPTGAIATFCIALMHFSLLQTQPFGFGDPAQWLPMLALAFGALYIFVLRPMKSRKRKSDPMEELPFRKNMAQQRHVEREMQNLLVELSEMSRKMTAQVDSRTTKLEVLLEEADAKIAELRALSENVPRPTDRYRADPADLAMGATHTSSALRTKNLTTEPAVDPRHAEIYSLADQGRTPAEIADRLRRPRGEIELILALRGK